MTLYRIILIVHLFGLAFGLGGASTLDSIVLVACRRRRISRDLMDVLHAASGLVAAAMVLLSLSGAAFFLVGVQATPKFWAKMVIVLVACANGIVAHRLIFPALTEASATGAGRLCLRRRTARIAAISAAISSISWSAALILGAWRGLTLGMAPILAAYAAMLCAAMLVSMFLVAPRVFDFTDGKRESRRANPLAGIAGFPAAVANALALWVANAALAIATRLHRWSQRASSQHAHEGRVAYDAGWNDWLFSSGVMDRTNPLTESRMNRPWGTPNSDGPLFRSLLHPHEECGTEGPGQPR